MDATVAYKQAALNCFDYLNRLGYSREQACEWIQDQSTASPY